MSSTTGGVTTRRQKKNREFEHVLIEIFAQDDNSPLRLALAEAQVQDVPSIVTLSNDDIDALVFPVDPGEGKTKALNPLHPGSKNLIRIFQDYIQEQQELLKENNIDTPVDVLTLDPDDFDTFRINRYAGRRMTGMSVHSHSNVPSPLGTDFTTPAKAGSSPRFGAGVVNSGASFSSAVSRQQRSSAVKRDKNHYKEYKTDKSWDEWENSTRSTARAHGCGQVLDANYVPSSDDELIDFVEQQSFMYSVFVDKVQTLQGKRIVNKYKTTFDAQKVFAELSDHAMKSTSAALNSSNILTFLTSDRLDLNTWKFTTEDYVLVWLNKLRVSIESNFHDMVLSEQDGSLEAHRTHFEGRKPYRPTMRGEVWRQLSKEGQTAWDQLSDQDKRVILDGAKARQARQVSFHDVVPEPEDLLVDGTTVDEQTPEADGGTEPSLEVMAHDVLSKTNPTTPPPGNVRQCHIPHQQTTCFHIISFASLVDRGANGGIAGDDVRIIAKTDRRVDISGIDSHEVNDIPIVSVGGVVQSQAGPLLLIFHQYGSLGRGKSIHSSLRLESFGTQVFDMSSRFNPQGQRLITSEGYVLPLDITNGLPYLPIRPYSDHDWDTLPHVIMTSDTDWDPSIYDNQIPDPVPTGQFDLTGQYRFRSNLDLEQQDPIDSQDRISIRSVYSLVTSEHQVQSPQAVAGIHPDAAPLQSYFLYQDPELISRTFRATTRFARMPMGRPLLSKTFRSPFPACNVLRRNEPVATDTIKASCPSLDGGHSYAQIFVGRHTLVIDVFPMLSPKHFVSTLEDVIRYRGAMDTIISDRGSNEISQRVKDILRALHIRDWTSEAHYQHQNHAERHYRDLKTTTNLIFNLTGAPPTCWLFCLQYVAYILNHTENIPLKTRKRP
eukprot:Nitzschia sp. Nitz4//scaffold70_size99833//3673//6700//NITZ4_004582-RA/size99833-snap-gene-0.139-mRNA-1//-1//CDS//3329557096//8058//frame0